uniref:Uncharacterized protein n=1 Tax=Sphaerodactylus townsendi TaxID=933632 RepID=A0ACB8ENG2_9SAUR
MHNSSKSRSKPHTTNCRTTHKPEIPYRPMPTKPKDSQSLRQFGRATSRRLRAGDNLPINFNVKTSNPNLMDQIHYFTYIIMTKGKIFKTGRQIKARGQNLVTMTLPITPDLIPSFRIVAYFQRGNSEIVADSVWVDVKDTCMGTKDFQLGAFSVSDLIVTFAQQLVVTGATAADNKVQSPGTRMKIKLEGDANAYVGLIWDTVEKSDIGCTAGSGSNHVGVFADAGLALETSNQISTPQRSDPKCPQPARRRRRSLQLLDFKTSKGTGEEAGPGRLPQYVQM